MEKLNVPRKQIDQIVGKKDVTLLANLVKEINVNDEGVSTVDFSPCCKFMATAGQDGLVKVWDIAGDDKQAPARLLATFSRHVGTVHTVRFFADGKRLASGGRDGNAMIWDVGAICGHP